jgi:oligopeptide/dipeptide ABC transporter ATP-binding protein
MESDVILEVKDLTVSFKTKRGVAKAVNEVNFELHKGDILGLVGESGCGKSVTSKSILRILPPSITQMSGHIYYMGKDILSIGEKEMSEIRGHKISMIFQEPMVSLDPLFSIGNQLREVLMTHTAMSKTEAEAKVLSMLKEVGIPSPEIRVNQYPFELSGGMRQRVMIAMGLLLHPDILIADEPTTALDVTIQAQILQLLKDINQKFGTAIILITHDLGVIAQCAHRVAVMYAGKIVEMASTANLFRSPLHPYTQGLLKSVPSMKKMEGMMPSIPGVVPSIYDLPKGCAFCARCPYAMDICRQGAVPAAEYPDRMVRCWKYRKGTSM